MECRRRTLDKQSLQGAFEKQTRRLSDGGAMAAYSQECGVYAYEKKSEIKGTY